MGKAHSEIEKPRFPWYKRLLVPVRYKLVA